MISISRMYVEVGIIATLTFHLEAKRLLDYVIWN